MKKVLFLTALLGLMSVSCDKKLEVNPGEVTCKLTVHTVEYDSHIPVKSVTVEILGMGKAKKTNESGVAQFNLPVGEYEMKISSDGYADFIRTVSVEIENESSDLPIAGNQTIDTYMYPLSGTVKGSTTINRDRKVSYQGNVTLKVNSNYWRTSFITSYTATSNEDGSFEITNLPVGISLAISGEYTENNVFYSSSDDDYTTFTLKKNVTTTISAVKVTRRGNVYTPDIIEIPKSSNAPLKISFPIPIDAADIKTGNISVKRNSYEIGTKYEFADNNRTLLITTIDTDGWRMIDFDPRSYYYQIEIRSKNGDRFTASGSFNITNQPLGGAISNLSIIYDVDNHTITWNKLPNAETYDIYVKQSDRPDYMNFESIPADATAATTQSIDIHSKLDQYFSIYTERTGPFHIKIIGKNAESKGDLEQATITTVNYTPSGW